MSEYRILEGDVLNMLSTLADESIHCVVTSPPYWGLRDYGVEARAWPLCSYIPMPGMSEVTVPPMVCCLGLEPTPEAFIAHMVLVFRDVWRVMRKDATCWVNMGDSYSANHGSGSVSPVIKQASNTGSLLDTSRKPTSGLKSKDLCGIPWRLAFALQADGWYLRSDIIWSKSNPMPESVTDRPTKAHEYIFLMTRNERYFYDSEAVKENCTQDEYANGFRGGCYVAGATDNQEMGKRQTVGNKRYSFSRKTNTTPPPGQPAQHREDREEVFYSGRRNKRTVWNVATYPFKEAHYATFPPDPIRPCILAGTSARGGCPKCGAPWIRTSAKIDTGRTQKKADGWDTGKGAHVTIHRKGREKGETAQPVTVSISTGWQPTCKCGLQVVVPCTVLDIFSGSGTTGVVSLQEGRDYIGTELSPVNVAMSVKRIEREAAQRPLLVA